MLPFFDPFRGIDFLSMLIKLLAAALCGALIGLERSVKNRPAGFRTHILVCLAGAAASVTGHFLLLGLNLPSDVTRISSQVIAGLGFIGAGTIIVTGAKNVIGLTTAAGLWTTGIIGLAFGSGFYEGGLLGTALLLIAQAALGRIGSGVREIPRFAAEIDYTDKETLNCVLRRCEERGMDIRRLRIDTVSSGSPAFRAFIQMRGYCRPDALLDELRSIPGVHSVRETAAD